jgi:tetratricopeptide (TPR) repeat protein
VFHYGGSVRHVPFLTALGGLDEGSPAWRAVSAGLVVLRLVDAWVTESAAVVAADEWGMRSVQAAVEQMPVGTPARAVLHGVVDAIKTSRASDMDTIAPRLMAYGRSLELDAKWGLAVDVYETIVAYVHPRDANDIAVSAQIRAGHCFRNLGQLALAANHFDAAGTLASHMGDMGGTLRAQIGTAKIAIARGNLPQAEQLLDSAVALARRHQLNEVQSTALHDRADVAHMRGNYELAIRLAYEALDRSEDPRSRDRLLNDIAASFHVLGVRSAARDAYVILEATAQEQYQRWVASINLMQMAAEDGSSPVFERYRRALCAADLPPELLVQVLVHIGEGYELLGDDTLAAASLAKARVVADEYGFHRLWHIADERLRRVGLDPRASRKVERQPPVDVVAIASQIRSMRESAGIG